MNSNHRLSKNKLLGPNALLTQQQNYESTLSGDDADSDDDDLFTNFNMTAPVAVNEADYLSTVDDIIIDDDHEQAKASPKYDCSLINSEPSSNMFLHHPHFNGANKECQCAMSAFTD